MRLHEAVNTGDLELISKTIDDTVAPDVRLGTPLPVNATGARAVKQVWEILLRAYPDLKITAEDLIAEGDRVVGRQVVTGTHQGEYMGIPPTGRSVTYNEIFIFRVGDDGRIADIWGVVDVLAQLRQLGVAPPVATPGS
ncbi:MAG: ester cyclase [Mycobacteriales bacterium]